jgi:hypothetical protein
MLDLAPREEFLAAYTRLAALVVEGARARLAAAHHQPLVRARICRSRNRREAEAALHRGSAHGCVKTLRRFVPANAFDRQIRKLNRLAG